MGFLSTLGKIGGAAAGFATGGPAGALAGYKLGGSIGGAVGGVKNALFGSDPGEAPREALTDFGMRGSESPLGGQIQESAAALLGEGVAKQGAINRMAKGRQLARMGLTGTELGSDFLDDTELSQQEALVGGLRDIKLGLLNKQLQALGIGAGQERKPGLIESAAPVATAYFLGKD